ncbi:MAG TPA: cobalamin-binding protein [Candidatus Limnocylindria bacterium]|nr:cobalamin-binding protein [Candidatus Limnocylindria bacterium]
MRVVSLLPAATEIAAALGCADRLVGVSHECDFPAEVASLPRVTRCAIHGNALPSAETDRWVRETLASSGTLYTLEEDLVRALAPDVIVTQRLCDVCAVGYDTVTAFAATLPGPPRVVNLEPVRLADVFADVRRIADALAVPERGEACVAALAARVDAVRRQTAGAPRRRCVVLEWIDPPFRGGHWTPDVVAAAGGIDPLGRAGEQAAAVPWDAVRAADPEVLVLACCGYPIERTLADLPHLVARPGWGDLTAVRTDDVWVLDGSAYMSRPGPRLVDTIEILAGALHAALPDPSPAAARRVSTPS